MESEEPDDRRPEIELQTDDCQTEQLEIFRSFHRWRIQLAYHDNAYHFIEETVPIKSSIFSPKDNTNVEWSLSVYPNGKDDQCRGYISVFLNLESTNIPQMLVIYEFSTLNCYRRKCNRMTGTFDVKCGKKMSGGFPKFLDMMSLTREMVYFRSWVLSCKVYAIIKTEKAPSPTEKIVKDLSHLMEEQKLTDVTLVVSNGELKAHKAILAARSPVFARMFENDMREKKENIVKIDDLDQEAMKEVLRFVYTGTVENIKKNAWKLIAAAEKYQLDDMKEKCETVLLKCLTIKSAVKTLILADRYNLDRLKSKVIDFVNVHADQVVDTQAFKSLSTEQAHLIVEAYRVLASGTKKEKTSLRTIRKRNHIRRRRRSRRHVM